MSQNSRSVSLRGDANYKLALTVYAKKEGKKVSEIVREALDNHKEHSAGIKKELALFFASAAQLTEQSHIEITNEESHD